MHFLCDNLSAQAIFFFEYKLRHLMVRVWFLNKILVSSGCWTRIKLSTMKEPFHIKTSHSDQCRWSNFSRISFFLKGSQNFICALSVWYCFSEKSLIGDTNYIFMLLSKLMLQNMAIILRVNPYCLYSVLSF